MLRCGPIGPKVCVVSVITDGKLPVKYGNLRKRSEEGKIIFAFVSDYFYRYRFHFFDYRLHFHLGLKIEKTQKMISENRKLSFSFSSLLWCTQEFREKPHHVKRVHNQTSHPPP